MKYSLCIIGIFTKYVWINLLKDKKGKTVLNDFIKIINESNRKPNKLWVDQGRGFYNKLMQEFLGNNYILMYSKLKKDKSAMIERFIKQFKAKISKKVTANDSKSYLPHLNKLAIIILLMKILLMLIILFLLKKIETSLKAPTLMIRSEWLSIRRFLVKFTLKIG